LNQPNAAYGGQRRNFKVNDLNIISVVKGEIRFFIICSVL